MKKNKRIISLFIAITMSMSFVACKSDTTSDAPASAKEGSEKEKWYTVCEPETISRDESQAVQVYSYPKENLLGLERIEFYEDRIITVFNQEINDASEWALMRDEFQFWYVIQKPEERGEIEWNTLLGCENGEYFVASVVSNPDADLDLLNCFMEFSLYGGSRINASISIESDSTIIEAHIWRDGWADVSGENYIQVYDHLIGRWNSPQSQKESGWEANSVGQGQIEISIYATFPSYEVSDMLNEFMVQHPELNEKYTIYYSTEPLFVQERQMKDFLKGKYASNGPEMYIVCADEISEYTKGDWSHYFATYEDILGTDVMAKIQDAEISDYVVELGSNEEGKVVALNYQNSTGAFLYRRSIAKEVFGSDDPAIIEEVIGAGTGSWEKFLQAAEQMKEKGYAMVSGLGDLYYVADKAVQVPWEVNGKFRLDAQREAYIDLTEKMIVNGYTNDHVYGREDWMMDALGKGKRPVFGWFAPLSFKDNIATSNPAFGDYAVCRPNVNFWQSGSWLLASRHIMDDPDLKEFCAKFIEWVTLDTSETSFQYGWANGTIDYHKEKHAVSSGKVMSVADGSMDFLDGQNPYPIYMGVADSITTTGICAYDEYFGELLQELTDKYAHGEITKEELMEELYQLAGKLGMEI